ncbi:MAG: serine/threonine-protein kinase [Rhodothermales bacterium]
MGRFEPIGTIQPFLKLQEGDWADVYKAYDTSLERNVLLKRLRSEFENDREIAERFEKEARLMAQVQHGNIVQVLSSGRFGQAVYFVAEFIEGSSLAEMLAVRKMPPHLAVFILREFVSGLAAAHAKHIFHRDIKPANILLSEDGTVKLTDFGMASVLETSDESELRGTLSYLAPELLFQGEPGPASDLFSAGATFFEMITGQAAFRGQTSSEIFDQILDHDPLPVLAVNPHVSPDLIKISRRLLDKKPEQRYANCEALLKDIDVYVSKWTAFDGHKQLAFYNADPDNYSFTPDYIGGDEELPKELSEELSEEGAAPAEAIRSTPFMAKKWVQSSGLIFLFVIAGILWTSSAGSEHSTAENTVAGTSSISNAEAAGGPQIESTVVDSAAFNPETAEILEVASEIPAAPLEESRQIVATNAALAGEVAGNQAENDVPAIDTSNVVTTPQDTGNLLFGTLNVLCTPYCNVEIDNQLIGKAPPLLSVELSPGVHQLALIHPDLPVYQTDIVVTSQQTDSIKVALLDLVGTVEINVLPYAEVYIDNVFLGEIPPMQSFVLDPGEHILLLKHDILGSWTDTLLVAAGEKQPYYYNLIELLRE